MNKRVVEKIQKRAEAKILNGEPLSQMERITQNKVMAHWLGNEIVTRIRNLGKVGF